MADQQAPRPGIRAAAASLVAGARRAVTRGASAVLRKSYGDGLWIGTSTLSYPWPNAPMNWWQIATGQPRNDLERFGTVHACVKVISEDLARTPIKHYEEVDNVREEILTRAPSRVFLKPNRYQTRTDFILYIARCLLLVDGNAYLYPKMNGRGEIEEVYPLNPKAVWPYIHDDTGEIFYRYTSDPTTILAGLPVGEGASFLPQRALQHVRLHTPVHPLIGETPLYSAVISVLTGMEINQHVGHFFHNMGRPSGVLRHPKKLDANTYERIKERFMERVSGDQTGMPLILQEGMEWTPMTMSAVDSDLIASFNAAKLQVSEVYRVPSFLLSDVSKMTIGNVETLIQFYVKSCLGFYVEHLQEAFKQLFRLPRNETIIFDLEEALLKGDFAQRMEAYAKGIQNSVLVTNEARKKEKLRPVKFGDEARVQQQLVPLSYGAQLQPPGAAAPQGAKPAEPPPSTQDTPPMTAESVYQRIQREMQRAAA